MANVDADRTFERRHSNRGGVDYELVLTMAMLTTAVDNNIQFKLATERTCDEKFDDIYFENLSPSKIYHVQAKYVGDSSKKITYDSLASTSDSKYSLLTYFNSFCKLRKKFNYASSQHVHFILTTTLEMDLMELQQKGICVLKISDDDLWEYDTKELGAHYKLVVDDSDARKKLFDQLNELAFGLSKILTKYKKINLDQSPIIKCYIIPLKSMVFESEKSKIIFRSTFLDGRDLPRLAAAFRLMFLKAVNIQRNVTNTSDEASTITYLRGIKLDVVGKFAQSLLISEKTINIIVECKTIEDPDVDIKDALGYGLVIEKGNHLKFNMEFLYRTDLPSNLESLQQTLKEKLIVKGVNLEDGKVKIELADRLDSNASTYHWDFEDDYGNDCLLIDEFLKSFVIIKTAAKEEIDNNVIEKIKKGFGSKWNAIYSSLHTDLLKWMDSKDENNRGVYLDNDDNPYKTLKENVQSGVWFEVRNPALMFTGRKTELQELHTCLTEDKEARVTVVSQMASITGLGGIGKTQLALQYAHSYYEFYEGNVIWINAETTADVGGSFTRLAETLGIDTFWSDSRTTDKTKPKKSIRDIAQEVYVKFAKKKVLFIFDNAEGLMTQNKKFVGIKNLLPDVPPDTNKPYILITSRTSNWDSIKVLRLNVLCEEDAVKLIETSLTSKEDQNDMRSLVKQLESFPLALRQAVSYINQQAAIFKTLNRTFKIRDYIQEYKKEKAKLLNHQSKGDMYDIYMKTTFSTWQITIDRIGKTKGGRSAVKIFEIIAYLVPEYILTNLFMKKDNDIDTMRALKLLEQYSLIEVDLNVTHVHRLVQEVTRLKLKDAKREESVLKSAIGLIKKIWNWEPRVVMEATILSVWAHAVQYVDIVNNYVWNENESLLALATKHGVEIIVNSLIGVKNEKDGSAMEEIKKAFKVGSQFCQFNIWHYLLSENYEVLKSELKCALILCQINTHTTAVAFLMDKHFNYIKDFLGELLVLALMNGDEEVVKRLFKDENKKYVKDFLIVALEELPSARSPNDEKISKIISTYFLHPKWNTLIKRYLPELLIKAASRDWVEIVKTLIASNYEDVKYSIEEAYLKTNRQTPKAYLFLTTEHTNAVKKSLGQGLCILADLDKHEVVCEFLDVYYDYVKSHLGQYLDFVSKDPQRFNKYNAGRLLNQNYLAISGSLKTIIVRLSYYGSSSGIRIILDNYYEDVKDVLCTAFWAARLGNNEDVARHLFLNFRQNIKSTIGQGYLNALSYVNMRQVSDEIEFIKKHDRWIKAVLGERLVMAADLMNFIILSHILDNYYEDVKGYVVKALLKTASRQFCRDRRVLETLTKKEYYKDIKAALGDILICAASHNNTVLVMLLITSYNADVKQFIGTAFEALLTIDLRYQSHSIPPDYVLPQAVLDYLIGRYRNDVEMYVVKVLKTRTYNSLTYFLNKLMGVEFTELIRPHLGHVLYLSARQHNPWLTRTLMNDFYSDVRHSVGEAFLAYFDYYNSEVQLPFLVNDHYHDSLYDGFTKHHRNSPFFIFLDYYEDVKDYLGRALVLCVIFGHRIKMKVLLQGCHSGVCKRYLAEAIVGAAQNKRASIFIFLLRNYYELVKGALGRALLEGIAVGFNAAPQILFEEYYEDIKSFLGHALVLSVSKQNELLVNILCDPKYADDVKGYVNEAHLKAKELGNQSLMKMLIQ